MKIKSKNIFTVGLVIGGAALLMLASCKTTIPKNAVAVQNFSVDKYLGKWYEIARIDFKHEKGLNNVTAEYSLREDGLIKVDNKGFDYTKKEWRNSVGKAKFVDREDEAKLKVSFFGPFYAGYNVVALDPNYKYALVAGQDLDYLWILSREKTVPASVKENYLNVAKKIGYDVNRLLWVEHDK
jgi:apolipoprotein D and lipocalin family protein